MEKSVTTLYPVVFFDGEQDIDAGNIAVHPSLDFKHFQTLLAQKIGNPPHQISVVLICRKSFKSPEKRQKLPINERTNFFLILNQHNPSREDCFFHVILKKPRKERKGRARWDFEDRDSRFSGDNIPPEKMLLRRDPRVTGFPPHKTVTSPPYWYQLGRSDQISPFYDQIPMLESVVQNGYSLRKFENQMISNFYGGSEDGFVSGRDRICEFCSGSEGQPVPFHLCIYDTMTAGFRGPSPAGPIERPGKGHMGSTGAGHIKAAA